MTRKTREKQIIADEVIALNVVRMGGVDKASTAALFGAGSSSDPYVLGSANTNALEFRVKTTVTSGDTRGIYNRLYLAGAGVSGESLRAFTTVDDVAAATAHGAHISLNFDTSGSITGLGVATRATLHIPNAAMSGGTYAALQAEIWADGASSDISGTTSHSLIRATVGGNATGAATVTNFMDIAIPAAMVGSGTLVDTDITTHTAYGGLPVTINGTTKYIALVSD